MSFFVIPDLNKKINLFIIHVIIMIGSTIPAGFIFSLIDYNPYHISGLIIGFFGVYLGMVIQKSDILKEK